MIELDINKVKEAITIIKPGVDKYLAIMNRLHSCDVSSNREFQKEFNGFYRIRQKPKDFYTKYYGFLEKHKTTQVSFEKTLDYIYKEFNRFEPSFSSKLAATINPNMPIWDSVVLKNLKIVPPKYYEKERISKTIKTYELLVSWYNDFMTTKQSKQFIELFDEAFPKCNISNVKKIDFILWQYGR